MGTVGQHPSSAVPQFLQVFHRGMDVPSAEVRAGVTITHTPSPLKGYTSLPRGTWASPWGVLQPRNVCASGRQEQPPCKSKGNWYIVPLWMEHSTALKKDMLPRRCCHGNTSGRPCTLIFHSGSYYRDSRHSNYTKPSIVILVE